MKKSAILAAALLSACNSTPPELLPPPFGPNGKTDPRLFFPTGLAQTPAGLVVANGNFNRAFEAGTVVLISRSYIDSLILQSSLPPSAAVDCDVDPATLDTASTAACYPQIPADQFLGPPNHAVLIGNYAGPIALNKAGTAAFAGSRDTGRLNAVRIGSDGTLGCLPNAGDDARQDCRQGLALKSGGTNTTLVSAGVDGPYTIVAGDTIDPGDETRTPRDVLFVSSIIPHINSVSSGSIQSSTAVAVLDMQDPTQLRFTMRAGGNFDITAGTAPGPMVFDAVRRNLYLSGCYQRSTAFGAGEPGTGLCISSSVNYLRTLNVDAQSFADPLILDLRGDVLSVFTTQLLLDSPHDTAGNPLAPTTLWATMRAPDTLVRIDLPDVPSVSPRVRQIIPLPISPAEMVRIGRTGKPDLLAIVGERNNSVVIFDTGTSEVVAKVGRLGDSPFMIQRIDCPATRTSSACLAVSVFGECRIALIEVPVDQPSETALRALAGSCPK
jgi:hypothetical protein